MTKRAPNNLTTAPLNALIDADKSPVVPGMKKGLTSYGDAGFSLFLRKAFIKGAGYSDKALAAHPLEARARRCERHGAYFRWAHSSLMWIRSGVGSGWSAPTLCARISP